MTPLISVVATKEEANESYWICDRKLEAERSCGFKNAIDHSRCTNCRGWKNGKKPTKQKTDGMQIGRYSNHDEFSRRYVGVSWNKMGKKFEAYVSINAKKCRLGKLNKLSCQSTD